MIREYNKGGKNRTNKDEKIKPLGLTEQEISYIAAFIRSLTDDKFMKNPALKSPWPQ